MTTSDNQRAGLKAKALSYLSRREHSRAELFRKLRPSLKREKREDRQADTQELERLLDALADDGWLSDSRFADSLVYRRAPQFGAERIMAELKRHCIDPALIDTVSAQLRESEMRRAKAVWEKKFGALPATVTERARQTRFLASRGFPQATIAQLLRGDDELSNLSPFSRQAGEGQG